MLILPQCARVYNKNVVFITIATSMKTTMLKLKIKLNIIKIMMETNVFDFD